jgi:exonuclease SbcD
MRLLHTGDWHVGKTIRGRSRADEHQAVLTEMVEIARDQRVDVVLVAGDLFETAAPTPESEKIVYRALMQFAGMAEHVVVIGGNHDNQRRLEAVQPLLALTKVHVTPSVVAPDAGGVLELALKSGERARVAMLPFVSQRGIVHADDLMGADADDHSMNYAERLCQVVSALCPVAEQQSVNLLLAHAMVVGGRMGGGERDAHTIFEYSIPTTAFPAHLHYVALGHLHRAQSLQGRAPIEYAGSALALDFGEEADQKSVTIIEAVGGKPARTERIPLAKGRRLRTIKGTLLELTARAERLADDYLRLEVTDKHSPGLADAVRKIMPNAVEVRVTQHEVRAAQLGERAAAMKGSPIELFEMYLDERNERDQSVLALFKELLEEPYASTAA